MRDLLELLEHFLLDLKKNFDKFTHLFLVHDPIFIRIKAVKYFLHLSVRQFKEFQPHVLDLLINLVKVEMAALIQVEGDPDAL